MFLNRLGIKYINRYKLKIYFPIKSSLVNKIYFSTIISNVDDKFRSSSNEKDKKKIEKTEKVDDNRIEKFLKYMNRSEEDSNNKDKKDSNSNNTNYNRNLFLVSLVTGFIVFYYLFYSENIFYRKISFQEFDSDYLSKGKVKSISVLNNRDAYVELHGQQSNFYFTIGSIENFERKLDQIQDEYNIDPNERIPIYYNDRKDLITTLGTLLPIGLTLFILYSIYRFSSKMGGGSSGTLNQVFNIGKMKVDLEAQKPKVTYKDVAGCDEAKFEIQEFVDFLKNPEKYTEIGARLPRGALLVGPPGTGKTLLAKATAGEASVPFFSISGSDFIEMFVGVGASRVRDLFAKAKTKAPCIVFIDEIDAVARSRGKIVGGANDERENTLNQLLVEMDGFNSNDKVIVLAGTNRVDILDKAILRPGRFDRQISVDLPDKKGRKEIARIYIEKIEIEDDKDFIAEKVALLTPGMSGADISNICNEAAIFAARRSAKKVSLDDFYKAIDRVIGGLEKKNRVLSDHERKIVAHHEAGHVIVSWFLPHTDPLLKVTIIPRGVAALGFAQYQLNEIFLRSRENLMDMISMALGGRASEQIIFNSITTGAADDLSKVMRIAYGMVKVYGMSDIIGNLNYGESSTIYEEKIYSEATHKMIDDEAKKIVDSCYSRALDIITSKRDLLEKISMELLDKETLYFEDIERICGKKISIEY